MRSLVCPIMLSRASFPGRHAKFQTRRLSLTSASHITTICSHRGCAVWYRVNEKLCSGCIIKGVDGCKQLSESESNDSHCQGKQGCACATLEMFVVTTGLDTTPGKSKASGNLTHKYEQLRKVSRRLSATALFTF